MEDSIARGSLSLKLKNCPIVDLLREMIFKSTPVKYFFKISDTSNFNLSD